MEGERLRRKREYIRNFMQEYRGKQRKAKEILLAQIDRLEERVSKLRSRSNPSEGSILSWRDVTAAVHDLRQETTMENHALKRHVREYEIILDEMKAWVTTSAIQTTFPNPRKTSWRDISLLKHPKSRHLGKEWITQQMYHNIDRVFQQYKMQSPISNDIYTELFDKSMEIEFTDQGYSYVQRMQKKWAVPLEVVVAMFKQHTGSMFTMDAFCPAGSQSHVEEVGNTILHHYSPEICGGFAVNLLCGEFREADRTILVIQHIQSDETIASMGRQRSRMVWIELRRESLNVTRERFLCVVSHEIGSNGEPVDLVQAGCQWGVDLNCVEEDQREARFLQAYRRRNASLISPRRIWYADMLAVGRQTVKNQSHD